METDVTEILGFPTALNYGTLNYSEGELEETIKYLSHNMMRTDWCIYRLLSNNKRFESAGGNNTNALTINALFHTFYVI